MRFYKSGLGRWAAWAALLISVCLMGIGRPALAGDGPLTADDVRLLLIGGAAPSKMVALIEQRGIGFTLTAELEQKFRDDGASDTVVQALRKAQNKPALAPTVPTPAAAPASPEAPSTNAHAEAQPTSAQPSSTGSSASDREKAEAAAATVDSPSTEKKISNVLDELSAPSGTRVDDRPQAPAFVLKDLSGHPLSLDTYQGKVILLDFWATWCPQCRKEIPAFIRLERQYRDRGFQVIGISVDNTARPVRKFYEDYMMNYPVAMCDSLTRRVYGGLTGVPTTFLIARDGHIESKMVGAPDNMEAYLGSFEARIQKLLGPQTDHRVMASAPPPLPKPVLVASAGKAPTPSAAPASAPAEPGASSRATSPPTIAAKAAAPPARPAPDLSDPAPGQIQNIIREFTDKEKLFKEARNNYTYHQVNKVETLDGTVMSTGSHEQEWDILFDDSGKRIERVTYAPLDTLKRIIDDPEDLDAFRNIQPFVLTSDELPEYEVKYLGHVKVDEITAYVFSVRPKELVKGGSTFRAWFGWTTVTCRL